MSHRPPCQSPLSKTTQKRHNSNGNDPTTASAYHQQLNTQCQLKNVNKMQMTPADRSRRCQDSPRAFPTTEKDTVSGVTPPNKPEHNRITYPQIQRSTTTAEHTSHGTSRYPQESSVRRSKSTERERHPGYVYST